MRRAVLAFPILSVAGCSATEEPDTGAIGAAIGAFGTPAGTPGGVPGHATWVYDLERLRRAGLDGGEVGWVAASLFAPGTWEGEGTMRIERGKLVVSQRKLATHGVLGWPARRSQRLVDLFSVVQVVRDRLMDLDERQEREVGLDLLVRVVAGVGRRHVHDSHARVRGDHGDSIGAEA